MLCVICSAIRCAGIELPAIKEHQDQCRMQNIGEPILNICAVQSIEHLSALCGRNSGTTLINYSLPDRGMYKSLVRKLNVMRSGMHVVRSVSQLQGCS